jgi:hypothetical protein
MTLTANVRTTIDAVVQILTRAGQMCCRDRSHMHFVCIKKLAFYRTKYAVKPSNMRLNIHLCMHIVHITPTHRFKVRIYRLIHITFDLYEIKMQPVIRFQFKT